VKKPGVLLTGANRFQTIYLAQAKLHELYNGERYEHGGIFGKLRLVFLFSSPLGPVAAWLLSPCVYQILFGVSARSPKDLSQSACVPEKLLKIIKDYIFFRPHSGDIVVSTMRLSVDKRCIC
jgi:hypothetical protein